MLRVLLFLFLTIDTMAIELYPTKECQLYNNLKHTKNRGNEVLQLDKSYEMLRHHKGQYLLKVKNATPMQRWVDESCLTKRPPVSSPFDGATKKGLTSEKVVIADELARVNIDVKHKLNTFDYPSQVKKKVSKHNLLALSWHNAFCETHRYKKECKRTFGSLIRSKPRETQFVLHGLWPQPRYKMYCNVDNELKYADKSKRWSDLPCLALDANTEDALEKVMPGFASDLHKHEWIKHGTCYGTNAETYYKDAINLINQVNKSKFSKLFTKKIGKNITLKQIRSLADKEFGRGTGNRIELRCKRGLVTELWLHLGSGSDDLGTLLKRGKATSSRCKKGHVDKAGFGR